MKKLINIGRWLVFLSIIFFMTGVVILIFTGSMVIGEPTPTFYTMQKITVYGLILGGALFFIGWIFKKTDPYGVEDDDS